MKKDVVVPSLGESVSEVMIGRFLQSQGSYVKENTEIVEIESEKVNQVLYAPAAGVLNWVVHEGDKVAISAVLGWIDTSQQSLQHQDVPKQTVQKEPIQPPSLPLEVSIEQNQKPVQELSQEKEIRKHLSSIRLAIGRRLVKALHEAAMLTTFNEVDLSAIMQLRKTYQEEFVHKYGVKLGWMSFFVRAVVDALKAYPDFNAYLEGEELVLRQYYHIGIAVGTERGVMVPVLKHADRLVLHEIEQQIARYADLARRSQLALSDLEGGGFTITNGGVYGSLLSTPILNPPQVGILGMHKILERPIAVKGEVVIRPMMYLALSYDHRVVDGKEAVGCLVHIKSILEEPARLLF